MIYAYAQDLDIQSRKLGDLSLVRRDLVRSDWRPGEGKERQNHGLPGEVAERHVLVKMAGKRKIGSLITYS